MTNNPLFPSPLPTLATVSADLSALNVAEVAAGTRARGTAAARDLKLRVVVSDLHMLRSYVQGVADAHVESAASIIASAGLNARKAPDRVKAPLALKVGRVSGTLLVVAKAAGARAAYAWQWSLDQKTWTSLPDTLQARTSITGLTPGALVFARSRAITKAGEGDWTQIVSIVTH